MAFPDGVLLAKTVGRAVLRLAEADSRPFEFTALADSVGGSVAKPGS